MAAIDYHYIKINGLDVLSPRELAAAAADQGFPADFWGAANSIHVAIGFEPGVAYLVVPRTTMDALDVNNLHAITWTMNRAGTSHTNTYSYWTICDAKAVGIDGDSKSAYLLTLRDFRCLMKKSKVINKAYNVSTPDAYGITVSSRTWLEDTLNSGALWTWQEMLADVWGDLPAVAGSVPTLPWTPDHKPDSWRFHGISAWEAVKMIFDACQSSIKPVPGLTSFAAVDLATVQADVYSGLSLRLLRDERPKDPEQCVFPAKVTITFPKRAQTIEAVEHYAEEPVYAADQIATGISGAFTGTDRAVRYDLIGEVEDDGTIRNESDLDTAAANIAARIAARMSAAAQLYKVHSGVCHEVVLGTNTNEILIRDYGDDNGCVTESIGHLRTGLPTEAWTKPVRDLQLKHVECCLAEDHPGYGVVFTVKLMVWDADNNGHKPDPNDTDTHYAIDWRYGMPYPDAGARGLFVKRRGTCNSVKVDMYEVVSLDCEPPEIDCTEAEVATCP